MGYNGSGVARASYAGCQLAHQMLGNTDALSAWSELSFERMPFRSFAPLGVKIAMTWKRFQDSYS